MSIVDYEFNPLYIGNQKIRIIQVYDANLYANTDFIQVIGKYNRQYLIR